MAFNQQRFVRNTVAFNAGQITTSNNPSATPVVSNGPAWFTYASSSDLIATIAAANYFADVVYDLSVNDRIDVTGSDASGFYLVAAVDREAGTVSLSSYSAVGIVGTANIQDGAVTTAKLAADAVTNAKIADDAVDTENIADDAITAALIDDGAVGTAALAADAVTNAKIADGAVDTENIADDAITAALIDDGAVGTAALAADAVTNAKIADDAVSLEQLDSGIEFSHRVVYAGQPTSAGGAAAEAYTVTGAAATDLAFVQVVNNGTNNVTALQAVVTTNTLTVTFSADPGNDCVINYQLLRAAT